jgi:hypothetical protein
MKTFSKATGKSGYCSYFENVNIFSFSNYGPISLINNYSKVFEFVVHYYISHSFKNKLNLSKHDFIHSRSSATNW